MSFGMQNKKKGEEMRDNLKTTSDLNNSYEVEKKVKSVLERHHISMYRLSKITGIRYELIRRSLSFKRSLSANELVTILNCTNIPYEEVK